ncbi:SpoIIE family protein phosphatase [Streptomyces sp. T12]|uniref:SpoIIE family protein phosphatase n=1 Tax=Streptomyces sp. T12 TaxID=477697 RepID=UPI001C969A56|nr:SpoIIE family protein phosphatase [Streptomyces sp. T12]
MNGQPFDVRPDSMPPQNWSYEPDTRIPQSVNVVMKADGSVVGWSPQAQELLGLSARDVLHRPYEVFMSDPDERIGKALHRLDGVAFGPYPATLRHRDGGWLPGMVSASALLTAGERRQWLMRITTAHTPSSPDFHGALFDALLDGAPVALAVHDADLRCVLQNSELRRISGLTDAQRMGRTTSETLPGIEGEAVERRQREVLASGLPRTDEVRGTTPGDPSHEHVWADSMFPLRDGRGEIFAVAQAVLDVTEGVHARERLNLVAEVGSRVGSTLNVRQTAVELAGATVPLFADTVCVHLLEEVLNGGLPAPGPMSLHAVHELRCAASRPEQSASADPHSPGAGRSAVCACGSDPAELRALTTGTVTVGTGGSDTADATTGSAFTHGPGAFHLYVPMVTRGVTLGVVVFSRGTTREQFVEADVLLAEEIVARSAVSIDNARRYRRERATALALQRSLLGQSETCSTAVEVAAVYRPAGGDLGLGGDWYDVVPLSGARVALVVGDVVGHDLPAAATMGRLRTAVRTLAELDLEPSDLLARLDDAVRRMDDEQSTPLAGEDQVTARPTVAPVGSTCLYAVYDPVSTRCTFASAGHMAPIVLTGPGTTEFADVPVGPPLGLGGPPFEAIETMLPEGTLLALYTNGLVQQGPDKELTTGLQSLRQQIAGSAPACALRQLCQETVDALVPRSPPDDAVLLLARTRALNPDDYATWAIGVDPQQVALLRAAVTDQLEHWDLSALQYSTELVVSELVTNVLRYGAPPAHLRLIKDRALICEVSDGSSTSPHLRRAGTSDEGGRGLFLVSQLAQAWGTRYSDAGKTIWAEQSLVQGSGELAVL